MNDRKAVIKAWSSQYRNAGKKEKGQILDELIALTWNNRWHVVALLRWDGKVIRCWFGQRNKAPPWQATGYLLVGWR